MERQLDMFEVINTRNNIPDKEIPKDAKLKDNQKWCPYCSKPVIFVRDHGHGVNRCPYCSISDKDYNVKMVNNRWL